MFWIYLICTASFISMLMIVILHLIEEYKNSQTRLDRAFKIAKEREDK